MIQTNVKFSNIIWKQMIIKNLGYLFLNVFTKSKVSQRHSWNLSKRAKFLLIFYSNTRRKKINQVGAFRMDWYSLISIHKSSSSAMLSECLIVLDIWVEKLSYEHLKPCLNKDWTAISNLQCSLLAFERLLKSLKIWKSELD